MSGTAHGPCCSNLETPLNPATLTHKLINFKLMNSLLRVHHRAAVGVQHLAGKVRGVVGGQEHVARTCFRRLAGAAQRHVLAERSWLFVFLVSAISVRRKARGVQRVGQFSYSRVSEERFHAKTQRRRAKTAKGIWLFPLLRQYALCYIIRIFYQMLLFGKENNNSNN